MAPQNIIAQRFEHDMLRLWPLNRFYSVFNWTLAYRF